MTRKNRRHNKKKQSKKSWRVSVKKIRGEKQCNEAVAEIPMEEEIPQSSAKSDSLENVSNDVTITKDNESLSEPVEEEIPQGSAKSDSLEKVPNDVTITEDNESLSELEVSEGKEIPQGSAKSSDSSEEPSLFDVTLAEDNESFSELEISGEEETSRCSENFYSSNEASHDPRLTDDNEYFSELEISGEKEDSQSCANLDSPDETSYNIINTEEISGEKEDSQSCANLDSPDETSYNIINTEELENSRGIEISDSSKEESYDDILTDDNDSFCELDFSTKTTKIASDDQSTEEEDLGIGNTASDNSRTSNQQLLSSSDASLSSMQEDAGTSSTLEISTADIPEALPPTIAEEMQKILKQYDQMRVDFNKTMDMFQAIQKSSSTSSSSSIHVDAATSPSAEISTTGDIFAHRSQVMETILKLDKNIDKMRNIFNEQKGIHNANLAAKTPKQTESVTNNTDSSDESFYDESDYEESDFKSSISDSDDIRGVIRGLPLYFTEEEIIDQLKSQRLSPIAVHRMISPLTSQPMPLVLVQVPGNEKTQLFQMKYFFCSSVTVEELGYGYQISQCTICRKFGHYSFKCDLSRSLSEATKTAPDSQTTEDLGIENIESFYEESDYEEYASHESDVETFISINNDIKGVIRGLPLYFTEEQIIDQLRSQHLSPLAVHRMISPTTSQPMPLVIVQVPGNKKNLLYQMKHFFGSPVTVEEFGQGYHVSQCIQCRKFGHYSVECKVSSSLTDATKTAPDNQTTEDLGIGNTASDNSMTSNLQLSSGNASELSMHENAGSSTSEIHTASPVSYSPQVVEDIQNILLKSVEQMCTSFKEQIDTYQTERSANACYSLILKGIPVEVKTIHVLDDLKAKGFSIQKIYRLKDEDDTATEDLAFQLPKDEDHIFYVSCCLGFHVVVDEYKNDFNRVEQRAILMEKDIEYSMKVPVNMLIRGVPVDVSEKAVKEDLLSKHFNPVAVHRLIQTLPLKNQIPMPMLLVKMHREERYVGNLICLLGFPVTVEPFLNHMYPVNQCAGCHAFGHSKNKCPGKIVEEVKEFNPRQVSNIINVVVKGVPLEYEDDKIIMDHLNSSGFNPIAIHRMVVDTDILPMYLVQIPKKETRILGWSCCLGFNVTVETHRPELYDFVQCDHCKDIGHTEILCKTKREEQGQRETTKEEPQNDQQKLNFKELKYNKKLNYNDIMKQHESESPRKRKASSDSECRKCRCRYNSSSSEAAQDMTLSEHEDGGATQKIDDVANVVKAKVVMKDASTSPESPYESVHRMKCDVKTYQNVMNQFLRAVGTMCTSFEQYDDDSTNLVALVSYVWNKQKLSSITTPLVDAMTTTLKSVTGLMMDLPNIPGVKSHTLDEQLHLLEKFEDLKQNIGSCPGRLSDNYDANFPKLTSDGD